MRPAPAAAATAAPRARGVGEIGGRGDRPLAAAEPADRRRPPTPRVRSFTATVAPAARSALAMAKPRPRPAPVTSATLPEKSVAHPR